jgi:hypothetical protein
MTSPAYTIGKDELLLITTRWSDGSTVMLETEMRPYKAAEIQALIDETVSEKCTVIDVEAYDRVKKCGMSIAEDFDVRSFAEREEDRREQEYEEELRYPRVYNARRLPAGNLTHAVQGLGAGV